MEICLSLQAGITAFNCLGLGFGNLICQKNK